MNILNRASIRSVLPMAISLVLVSLALGLWASVSASASNYSAPIDRQTPDECLCFLKPTHELSDSRSALIMKLLPLNHS